MEFVFKPEKLTENLSYEVSEAIAKRAEIFSRKKLPGLWEKTDKLNAQNLSEPANKRRKIFRKINGIICIALGIFLFIPGIVAPKELFVPMIVGAFAIVFGFSAVIPRKTNAEKYKKEAKKLISAINSSLKPEDTVVFGEEAIFENGALLMEYQELESVIETRNIFLICDGKKIMVLRKSDMVIGKAEEFGIFIEEKTDKKLYSCS